MRRGDGFRGAPGAEDKGGGPATPTLVAEIGEVAEFLTGVERALVAQHQAALARASAQGGEWEGAAVRHILASVFDGVAPAGTDAAVVREARRVLGATALEMRRLGRALIQGAALIAAELQHAAPRTTGSRDQASNRADGPTGASSAEVGEATGGAAPHGPRR